MYKVMIVEDEMFVRLGIKMSVDWAKLDMEVCADVANGEQAFQKYQEEHPDIILTDIKMPVMDGMELIHRVREKDQETRIVILSCMEEFSYVKEAISSGVSDYILKLTMTQEDMEKVMLKVRGELETLRHSHPGNTKIPKEKKNRLLLDYLYYGLANKEEIENDFRRMQIPLERRHLVMALLEIDHYEKLQEMFKDDYGRLVSDSLENVLEELMQEYGSGMVITEKNGRVILFASHTQFEQRQEAEYSFSWFIDKVQKTIKMFFHTTVSASISPVESGFEKMREMYRQCEENLEYKFYFHSGAKIRQQDIEKLSLENHVESVIQDFVSAEALSEEEKKKFSEIIQVFQKHPYKNTLVQTFKDLIDTEIRHSVLDRRKKTEFIGQYDEKTARAANLEELLEVWKEMKYMLYEDPSMQRRSRTVSYIIRYISEHYAENIMLEQIAEEVELSSNYICSLFKKEMGITLFQYLLEYRIDQAKDLLINTSLKSYEISERTGFTDESYFSRSFKKCVGQSPGEYRRSMLP